MRFKKHSSARWSSKCREEAVASYPGDHQWRGLHYTIDFQSKPNRLLLEEGAIKGLAREEEWMPGFKASKHRLTLLWGAKTAAVFKLNTMVFYWFESSRSLKNYAKSPLCMLCKSNNKAWMTADLFTIWLTEYFKPTVETCTQKKKKYYFQIITAD